MPHGHGSFTEDGADRVVELPNTAESGSERHVSGPQLGCLEKDPCRLRPLGPRQLERPRPHLGDEKPLQLARAVAEAVRQPGHAFAIDDPVGNRPHGSPDHIAATVPLRRSGGGIGPTPFAGPETAALGRR
jgi:hypothetical protein